MQTCTRRIHFCYGHRVMNHESKCATLHGHNGVVFLQATPIEGLDALGRVIDFSVLKEKIGNWIEEHWDHTMILYQEDKETIALLDKAPQFKKTFILESNPTAENLANHLLLKVCPKLLKGHGVMVNKVTFWETENCFAEAMLDANSEDLKKLY